MSPAAPLQLPIQATPLSQQAKPSPADREPTPKRPFAEMLQQSRNGAPVAAAMPVAAATAVQAPAAESTSNDDGEPAASHTAADTPDKSLPLRPRVRAAGGMTTCSAPTEAESAARVATTAANEPDDDAGAGRSATAHPAMEGSRVAVVAPVEPGRVASAANVARTNRAIDDLGIADAASTRQLPGSADTRTRGSRDDVATGRGAEPAAATNGASAALAAPLAAVALAEPAPPVAAIASHGGIDAAGAAALAASTTAAAPSADVAPTAAASPLVVATPVDSPDFATAFGLQVSLLAKDGVQQAELHLNPADLGPVSIRIALAGSEARIDFGADLASTRHAIEQGLPELAGALRDAGFTLAGGGVSQHAGERRRATAAAAAIAIAIAACHRSRPSTRPAWRARRRPPVPAASTCTPDACLRRGRGQRHETPAYRRFRATPAFHNFLHGPRPAHVRAGARQTGR